ncbi:MAG: choice-of-anchor J domain-containing protein [Bacteroidales bacterium]|nr:choice-of-anchor J domain-containing protein [Bacteroidales bacterium]MCK9449027.1 choice-of-anchor J domain-containing protein [Bacteroidales bacterium]MDY0369447.1 choice-of-anchor J domain-containing protein [Bacteroidales bacterium]
MRKKNTFLCWFFSLTAIALLLLGNSFVALAQNEAKKDEIRRLKIAEMERMMADQQIVHQPDNIIPLADAYCTATTNSGTFEYIARVQFGDIDNTTGWQGGVGDYTDQVNTMAAGGSETIIVTNSFNPDEDDLVTVWIDWNQDFEFGVGTDEEFILDMDDPDGESFSGTITVPAWVPEGDYRMRIRMVDGWGAIPTPCGNFAFGEVEDYTVMVTGGTGVVFPKPRNFTVTPNGLTALLEWDAPLLNVDVLYDNGPFINGPGQGAGGADISYLDSGLKTYGANINKTEGYRLADDFVVTENWDIERFTFYGYQTGSPTTSTITGAFLQIWNGVPGEGGQIIYGDMVSNVMISTEWTGIYRVDGPDLTNTDRPIMAVTAGTPGLSLLPGTYWVDFSVIGSIDSGPWGIPITITGETTTGNAKQFAQTVWQNWLDYGTSTQQGVPFVVEGSSDGLVNGPLLGYNIFRDGQQIATLGTDAISYLDNLLEDGVYEYQITAVYGDPYPGESAPVSASAIIVAPSAIPFVEDFEGNVFPPLYWQRYDIDSGGSQWTSGTRNHTPGGSKSAYHRYAIGNQDGWLVTRPIQLPAHSATLTFWSYNLDPEDYVNNSVWVSTGSGNPADNDFQQIWSPMSVTELWVETEVSLSQFAGETVYIAFRYSGNFAHSWYVDDVSIEEDPACPKPGNLIISDITSTSAKVSWTARGAESNWNLKYGSPGFDPESAGTLISNINITSHTITGLNSSTSYEVYVQANCGGGEYSLWVGPGIFATECGGAVTNFPWSESFDAAVIPACWKNEYVSGTYTWTFVTQNGSGNIKPRTGSHMAEFRNTSSDSKTKLVTPMLDLTNVPYPELTFYFANQNWIGDIDELRVFYKTSPNDAWVQIGDDYTDEHTSWTEVSLQLPNPTATYFIAFEATSNWARGMNIDDVLVQSNKTCLEPDGLSISQITQTSAKASWIPAGNESIWNLKYGSPGFDPDSEGIAIMGITNNSYTITGLALGTSYELYVQADCGDEEYSDWSESIVFTTKCEATEIPYLEYFDENYVECWSQEYEGGITSNRWDLSNTIQAGGSPNEMKAEGTNGTGISRLISPAFNTAGYDKITLSFKHYLKVNGAGLTYKIQTSSDGINWTDETWVYESGNGNRGPENVYRNLIYNLGDITYIAWVLDGNHNQLDNWYIDEVIVTEALTVTPIVQNLSCYNINDGSVELDIKGGLPPFTIYWEGPDEFTSIEQNIYGLAAGMYFYSVTDINSSNYSEFVEVTQPDRIPAPTVEDLTVTYDGLVHTIEAVAPANTELVWYDENGDETIALSANQAGIYTAWVAAREIPDQVPEPVQGCESVRIEVSLTIEPKGLTITADDKERCQFEPNPELTITYDGFVDGEGEEFLDELPQINTTATENSDPDNYPITVSGALSTNYDITYVEGTLTVVRAPNVDAGPDGAVCVSASFPIVAATASNYTDLLWTTSGNGTFSDATVVNPIYTPGSVDIANGSVILILTADAGSSCSQTSEMVLTLQNVLTVSVAVIQLTDIICTFTEAQFQALAVNGGLIPSYQWQLNGVDVGDDSDLFAYLPTDGDVLSVTLTSSIGCALNNPVDSEPFVVSVTPEQTAEVSITTESTNVCDNTMVTFTAIPVNGGSSPSYQWYVNQQAVGTDAAEFSYEPLDGDEIYVEMTSDHPCAVVADAVSNTIIMEVTPPLLMLIANPAHGGTVSGGDNYAIGSTVTVVATPAPGWEFLNWRDMNGDVISTDAEFDYTITKCYDELIAVFNYTVKIAGQLKYFNDNETLIPSPNNYGVFYVQLFEGETAIGGRQLVSFNPEFRLNSYYEFVGVESGKDYTLRIWEQSIRDRLDMVWTWNNWGGASSIDALIIAMMSVNHASLTMLPWIAPVTATEYTPYFAQVADVNNNNAITSADALLLQYAVTGNPEYRPLPDGSHYFNLATTYQANHGDKVYPNAPELVFTPVGEYAASMPASEIYYEVVLEDLKDGLNVYNIYFVATGDVNANYIPGSDAKASQMLAYEGTIQLNEDQIVRIPVRVDQEVQLGATTLAFAYDPQILEIVNVEDYPLHYIDQENGIVRISWFDMNGRSLSQGQAIVYLHAKIKSTLHLGDTYLELLAETEFADTNANKISVDLNVPYIETSESSLDGLSLTHACYPNPFNDLTEIQYVLPESGLVKVVVYNHFGQEILVLTDAQQTAGAHTLQLRSSELRDAGQYFYRIILEGSQKTWLSRGSVIYVK